MIVRCVIVLLCLLSAAACAADVDGDGDLDFRAVELNPADPAQDRIGRLLYLGGLDLTSKGGRFGGQSGIRWRDGRLHTVMDDGRWSSFEPVEAADRLTGVKDVATGALSGPNGAALNGKAQGDAESLTIAPDGGWLVSFERNHRIWRYSALDAPARPSEYDVGDIFGVLPANSGVEAIASPEGSLFACAQRQGRAEPNCYLIAQDERTGLSLPAPPPIDQLGGVPTDADTGAGGELFVLIRGYTREEGVGAAVVRRKSDGTIDTLAILKPPLSVDNMEGLAVRMVGERTFLYLISDNNFSSDQRTLLMKFEVLADE